MKDLPQESLLALIDIKNFGQINSFYGQEIGDRFLQSYGELLRTAHVQNEARFYQVQSDVFAVLGKGMGIESLQAYCTQGYILLDEMQFSLEVTIAYASNKETEQNLLTMAKTALMEAKKRGLASLSYGELGDGASKHTG
ncbi:MAG: diguanylate cyclase [Campylobacterales bacterium]|nr:diguanylate cyclase [Campylobacterales bacterium]